MRVGAGVTLVDLDQRAAPGGPLLPPGPTFMGAYRRRHHRHQRRRRRDVQVRHDARLGDGADGRAAGVAACSTSSAERSSPTPTDTSTSSCPIARSASRCPATGCRRPRSCRPATSPRRRWISSICSSARKARSASSPRPRCGCCRSGRRVPGVRAVRPCARGALAFVRQVRGLARDTWRTRDPSGIDVSAIEHMDARCLELLREDGVDRGQGVTIPPGTEMALLVTLELPAGHDRRPRVRGHRQRARCRRRRTRPLRRFCRLLDAAGVLDDVEVAVPGDERAREPAAGGARGGAGVGQPARRPREADDRPSHRENRRRHGRARSIGSKSCSARTRRRSARAASTSRSGATSRTATCIPTSSRDRSPTSKPARRSSWSWDARRFGWAGRRSPSTASAGTA